MIYFKSPKKTDILIFDECNSEFLIKLIDKKFNYTIIKQRPTFL